MEDTRDDAYAHRLTTLESVWWKRVLDVQAPYRWNLRRQDLGRTLDIGCGLGRNLANLSTDSVGVDHNASSIATARARGLNAFTVEQWEALPETSAERRPASYDALLLAHVVEHLTRDGARDLLSDYLPSLKPGGVVFFICPQEKGYRTDETHIVFTTGEDLEELSREVGLVPDHWFSFPFPRAAGKVFTYNEFCLKARKPR